MEPADIDGITLEYEDSGTGEAVVFIHGAFIADAFRPMLGESRLANGYRLITYHRRGYGGSSRSAGPMTVESQAADCRALLRYLGMLPPHVVGPLVRWPSSWRSILRISSTRWPCWSRR
jgi:pimeloyl-ACP methyl ester carboxylesterase